MEFRVLGAMVWDMDIGIEVEPSVYAIDDMYNIALFFFFFFFFFFFLKIPHRDLKICQILGVS